MPNLKIPSESQSQKATRKDPLPLTWKTGKMTSKFTFTLNPLAPLYEPSTTGLTTLTKADQVVPPMPLMIGSKPAPASSNQTDSTTPGQFQPFYPGTGQTSQESLKYSLPLSDSSSTCHMPLLGMPYQQHMLIGMKCSRIGSPFPLTSSSQKCTLPKI